MIGNQFLEVPYMKNDEYDNAILISKELKKMLNIKKQR